MNTIIAINWARDWVVVSFTDVENVYTLSLGGVTTLSGAKVRVRRVLSKYYGVTLSRMRFERSANAIDYLRANRVEEI